MKLKIKDLQLLMEYLKKEGCELVEIDQEPLDIGYSFTFKDVEHRSCIIKLYSSATNTTPDLTKSMKLYTRFGGGLKGEKKSLWHLPM